MNKKILKKVFLPILLFSLFIIIGGLLFFNSRQQALKFDGDWMPLLTSQEEIQDELYKYYKTDDNVCFNIPLSQNRCLGTHYFRKSFIEVDLDTFQIHKKYKNFSKDKNRLYYADLSRDYIVTVEDIDLPTIQILNEELFKDKSNVYYNARIHNDIEKTNQFDAATLEQLNRVILKDKNGIYVREYYDGGNYFSKVPGIDVESFEVKNDYFSVDKNNVFVYRKGTSFGDTTGPLAKVEGADPGTFEIIQQEGVEIEKGYEGEEWKFYKFGKDKSSVYYEYKKIDGADPTTFVPFPGLYQTYSKDAYHVFFLDKIVEGGDPKTFVSMDGYTGKDKNHVYEGEKVVVLPHNSLPNEFDVRLVKVGDTIAGMQITGIDTVREGFPLDPENSFISFSGQVSLKGRFRNVSKETAESEPFSFGEAYVGFTVSDPDSLRKLPDDFPDGENRGEVYFEFSNPQFAKKFFAPEDSSGEAEIIIKNYNIRRYPAEIAPPAVELVQVISKKTLTDM